MKIRTIQQCHQEIKENDPHTAITEYAIRQAVISGEIPSRKCGGKYLIDLDMVNKYFSMGGERI